MHPRKEIFGLGRCYLIELLCTGEVDMSGVGGNNTGVKLSPQFLSMLPKSKSSPCLSNF